MWKRPHVDTIKCIMCQHNEVKCFVKSYLYYHTTFILRNISELRISWKFSCKMRLHLGFLSLCQPATEFNVITICQIHLSKNMLPKNIFQVRLSFSFYNKKLYKTWNIRRNHWVCEILINPPIHAPNPNMPNVYYFLNFVELHIKT